MNFDFLLRLRQELRVTLSAAEETVLAVAERVNRKVQLLRLHWQASQLQDHLAGIHRELGRHLAERGSQPDLPAKSARIPDPPDPTAPTSSEPDGLLRRSSEQARGLKEQLERISARILSLRSEVIREDLLRFTRDLEFRGVTLQYLVVARGAPLAGRRLRDPALHVDAHVVGVLRGPLVVTPTSDETIQAGDSILIMGTPTAMQQCIDLATVSAAAPGAFDPDMVGRMSHS